MRYENVKCPLKASDFFRSFFFIWSFRLLRDRRQNLLLILTKSYVYQKLYGYLLISGEIEVN